MSSLFNTYLQLGFTHIADITAYDHIVFIIALCAIYRLSEWKHVLVLVTAFTVGHSITLALVILDLIQINTPLVEFLIPVTIFLTSIYNVIRPTNTANSKQYFRINYAAALFFGLIHGMGFSNFLRASLMPGEESSLLYQLLAFNIGIELGQLIIVACILGASFLALDKRKIKQREWNLFVSGAAAGIALVLMLENKFW
ncbi:MAG: HupE/UreJ family protein [Bacteroidota bacterium]